MAPAQITDEQRQSYQDWVKAAERADEAIEAARASNAAFEQLRAELVTYRQQFLEAQETNAVGIRNIQSQLDTLGPAPEEGTTEPQDIADLRARLDTQMKTLQVPVIVAQEAYTRANGQIAEIDQIIRDRQRRQMLQRNPVPITPARWSEAATDLFEVMREIGNETTTGLKNALEVQSIRNRAPLTGLYILIGLVLILRGSRWSHMAGDYLRGLSGFAGSGVWEFLVSLGRIILPMAGIYFLARAADETGVLGLRGTLLLERLPYFAAGLLAMHWLVDRLYSRQNDIAILKMSASDRAAARTAGIGLTYVLLFYGLLQFVLQVHTLSDASRAVFSLPLILIASALTMQLRQRGLNQIEAENDEEQTRTFKRLRPVFRTFALVAAVVSPLLAIAGFTNLAEAIVFPTVLTFAFCGLVIVLQNFFTRLYGLITGKGEAARESVTPAIISLLLIIGSLPFIALIWGVRVADLKELWLRFLKGFNIGDTVISPTDFLTFLVIFAIGYGLTRGLQGSLKSSLLPKTRIDLGGQNAIVSGVGYVGIFLSGLIAITTAGIDLSSLAIVAGALSVGIGFGLQNIVQNFVSGIILLIERPISEGDWIDVNGQTGYVRDISVRSTRIETFDRTDVIVPNGDLVSGVVTNYTRGNTVGRVIVPVGVAYGSDPRKVERILREIGEAHPMVLAQPAPAVIFQGFGADSMDFEIRAILRDVNWVLSVKSDMNYEIARRFAEEDIEIPFAQRDIWIKNPESLQPAIRPVDTRSDDTDTE